MGQVASRKKRDDCHLLIFCFLTPVAKMLIYSIKRYEGTFFLRILSLKKFGPICCWHLFTYPLFEVTYIKNMLQLLTHNW